MQAVQCFDVGSVKVWKTPEEVSYPRQLGEHECLDVKGVQSVRCFDVGSVKVRTPEKCLTHRS